MANLLLILMEKSINIYLQFVDGRHNSSPHKQYNTNNFRTNLLGSSRSKCFVQLFPLVYIEETVLLWFFVSVNVLFELIVGEKYSSQEILFLSFSFFTSLCFYTSVFCVPVCVFESMYILLYFGGGGFFYYSYPLKNLW